MSGNDSYEPFIITEGNSFSEVASLRGVTPSDVWNHPKNLDLKNSRADMNLLEPGDVVFLPKKTPSNCFEFKSGSENFFEATLFSRPPYPLLVLPRTEVWSPNLAVRVSVGWNDQVTEVNFNGAVLSCADYQVDEGGVIFMLREGLEGEAEGSVVCEGRAPRQFKLRTAETLTQKLDSLFAQSINLCALARIARKRAVEQGRGVHDQDGLEEAILLGAFHVREAILDEIERSITSDADKVVFLECAQNLPNLLKRDVRVIGRESHRSRAALVRTFD